MRVYNNPYSISHVPNNQNQSATNNLKHNGIKKDKLSFGVSNECFAKWMKLTAKGAEKDPDLVSNISFEIQKPTPEKKQALATALNNADDWYKGVLKSLDKAWNRKK